MTAKASWSCSYCLDQCKPVEVNNLNKMPQKAKLGQNFLVDRGARVRIVEALVDISEKTVVEIGPGKAAITELLAQKTSRLIAVELDRELAASLRQRFAERPVRVIEQDILTVDLDSL